MIINLVGTYGLSIQLGYTVEVKDVLLITHIAYIGVVILKFLKFLRSIKTVLK